MDALKYKAIIVDDEHKLREVLALKLAKVAPQIEIVDKCANAADAYESIVRYSPDIVFLDVSMPGESGFDLIKRFDKLDFEVIFVTGYDNYSLEALKVSAADYLLKPVDTEHLIQSIEKATTRVDDRVQLEHYDILKANFNLSNGRNARIAIPSTNAYDFIKVENIIRIEGWQKYTKVIVKGNKTVVSSYNLGAFRDMLEKFDFYQSHKSHIINVDCVDKYNKEGTVQMSNGDIVPVSRRKKDDFFAFMLNQNRLD